MAREDDAVNGVGMDVRRRRGSRPARSTSSSVADAEMCAEKTGRTDRPEGLLRLPRPRVPDEPVRDR